MTQRLHHRITPDELPSVSQKIQLVCKACSGRHTYDVGTIYIWSPEDQAAPTNRSYGFSKYFRCLDCDSAGPWEAADYLKLMALTMRAAVTKGDESVVFATPQLFDGTISQSPAWGEEHLLRLLEQEPGNAFLCTRLGNLLRSCSRKSQAAAWYDKALALDAGDIEARYHLFCFAVVDNDDPAAIAHARSLVRHLLGGCKTRSEELTRGIAFAVAELLRQAPPDVHGELVRVSQAAAGSPEIAFIRTLLTAQGDEDAILHNAADRLVGGESVSASAPLAATVTVPEEDDDNGSSIDLIPSLRALVETERLNARTLTVAAETGEDGRIRVKNRHSIFIFDGKGTAVWEVGALRELFRGDQAPPPNMDRYPPEYVRCFYSIEKHVLTACRAEGDRTDQEMEAIYSALRRLPDGKNHLGPLHDFLWQAAALTLGTHRLSQAEFVAVVGQLERSVRKWALRPVSRNYARYLREHGV